MKPRTRTEYENWMWRAIEVACDTPALGPDDPPVGAVIFDADGRELAAAHHDRVRTKDPTAVAQVLVLRRAAATVNSWRLLGCTLVTTLEPGVMAAGALVQARVPRLVLGAWDPVNGAVCSQWDLVRDPRLNHRIEVIPNILQEQTNKLVSGWPRRSS